MEKHTIFWADDDPDDLFIIQDVLRTAEEAFEINEFANGHELLQHLSNVHDPSGFPCLIVLDLNMPVLNGKETLAALRSEERYRAIPVVVFTTSSSAADQMYCQTYGVEMVTKPLTYSEMQEALGRVLLSCRFSDATNNLQHHR